MLRCTMLAGGLLAVAGLARGQVATLVGQAGGSGLGSLPFGTLHGQISASFSYGRPTAGQQQGSQPIVEVLNSIEAVGGRGCK